ncbi:MAG: DUF4339 domain-containing protein [Verrucomicrobiaceae bacterium]|nr:DUF4339 domain-containing protein [Verrucomicrobiaceae bacterium]
MFYVSKKGKTIGPCTADEVHNLLLYGSISVEDLIQSEGEEEWVPVMSVPEFQSHIKDSDLGSPKKGKPNIRRRIVRLREYDRVPYPQRGGVVLSGLILGLLNPISLWKSAASVYENKIYRRAKDPQGFLKTWSAWTDTAVTLYLITVLSIWAIAAYWVIVKTTPILREIIETTKETL